MPLTQPFKTAFSREVQPLNAKIPILDTFSGTITSVSFSQSAKAYESIVFKFTPNCTFVSDEHPEKA